MFSPDRYVEALEFAARAHGLRGQKIPGSELPYIVHPVSVAAEVIVALATTSVSDPDLAVVCALLHDTIEDTGATYPEVKAKFGALVANGVQALSKDERLPTKSEQMADSLRRIRLQPPEIWIVKLADRVINLSEPPSYWPSEKRRKYCEEGIFIADALGSASAMLDARLRARAASYKKFI